MILAVVCPYFQYGGIISEIIPSFQKPKRRKEPTHIDLITSIPLFWYYLDSFFSCCRALP